MRHAMAITAFSVAALSAALLVSCADSNPNAEFEKKLGDLDARVAALERQARQPQVVSRQETPEWVKAQRLKARERMAEDSKNYSQEDLRAIESLYQVANKSFGTPEAQRSLEALIAKYSKANRTGCAILYLGQMNEGDKRIEYLRQAIANHSDCFYGDGVQVGAYARLYLAGELGRRGEKARAKELYDEIKSKYPDAIDHAGNKLDNAIAAGLAALDKKAESKP